MAATAHEPVPHASVQPTPRSITRMLTGGRARGRVTNSTFAPPTVRGELLGQLLADDVAPARVVEHDDVRVADVGDDRACRRAVSPKVTSPMATLP